MDEYLWMDRTFRTCSASVAKITLASKAIGCVHAATVVSTWTGYTCSNLWKNSKNKTTNSKKMQAGTPYWSQSNHESGLDYLQYYQKVLKEDRGRETNPRTHWHVGCCIGKNIHVYSASLRGMKSRMQAEKLIALRHNRWHNKISTCTGEPLWCLLLENSPSEHKYPVNPTAHWHWKSLDPTLWQSPLFKHGDDSQG